jgi:hypothetical protein
MITAWVAGGRSREDLTTRRRGRRTGCEADVSSHPCAAALPWICRHHRKVSLGLTYQSLDMCVVSLWWKRGDCAAMRRHAQEMLSTSRKLATAQPPATKRANSGWLLAGLYIHQACLFLGNCDLHSFCDVHIAMDKFKAKTRTARNRLAEATSTGTGQGSLHVPHSSLAPHDNSSTLGVNEGFLGPRGATEARDFATAEDQPVQQPVVEPPTSLQSSVDAGLSVRKASNHGSPSKGSPR